MLRLVMELDTEASQSLTPDLVTRCGVVFLGTGDEDEQDFFFYFTMPDPIRKTTFWLFARMQISKMRKHRAAIS